MPLESRDPGDPATWMQFARSDLFMAEHKLEKTLLSAHCYHAQQCVEKCLKACCIHLNIHFPYTHDLAELLNVLVSQGKMVCPDWADDAKELTTYVTSGRYPGFDDPVTESEWEQSVAIARTVFEWSESQLRA